MYTEILTYFDFLVKWSFPACQDYFALEETGDEKDGQDGEQHQDQENAKGEERSEDE